MLDLARKESLSRRSAGAAPAVNLARAAREAAAVVLPLLENQGRRLVAEIPEKLPCRGHGDDLRDLIRNLLENALSHGSDTVSLTLRRERAGRGAVIVIAVADEGAGVPSGMEKAVFRRFHKLDASSRGAGLGLAIVRQVALSHGGTAEFRSGRGEVVVRLPDTAGAVVAATRATAASG